MDPGANQQLLDVAGRNVVGLNPQYIVTIFQVEIPLGNSRNFGEQGSYSAYLPFLFNTCWKYQDVHSGEWSVVSGEQWGVNSEGWIERGE